MKKYDTFWCMEIREVKAALIRNKTVLVRVDYNVPLEKYGKVWKVSDDTRLRRSLETLNLLRKYAKQVILISHLGRPKADNKQDLSLEPVAQHLQKLIKQPVHFFSQPIGAELKKELQKLPSHSVVMLENTRFYAGEKKNDRQLCVELASLAEIYVNDAFSAAHRAHASTVGITELLPSYAGKHLEEEVKYLSRLLQKPERPYAVVVGGKKISDKVAAVEHLLSLADVVLVGGGVANTFLKAAGFEVLQSFLEEGETLQEHHKNYVQLAHALLEKTEHDRHWLNNFIPLPKIVYPIDVVAAKSLQDTPQILDISDLPETIDDGLMYLDIGPKTQLLYKQILLETGTIFWNGPMGVFEHPNFAEGTKTVAHAIANSSALTVLGGGDTIAAIQHFGFAHRYDYVSAAGGAALEFLSGKKLPGLQPLLESKA